MFKRLGFFEDVARLALNMEMHGFRVLRINGRVACPVCGKLIRRLDDMGFDNCTITHQWCKGKSNDRSKAS